MTYEIVKRNYDQKLWDITVVALAVKKGIITAEQYEEITGEKYSAF